MTPETFQSINPAKGEFLPQVFTFANAEELESVLQRAHLAKSDFAQSTGAERARLLRTIADEIEALGDALIQLAMSETALPEARLLGERGRTCGQLRMFAALVEEGSYVEAIIDTAQPERKPLPKPDVRRILVPIGPIAVFGASNFPFAYSTAGGDTASALAAGCPVIVKGHGSHAGTSTMVAAAVSKAVSACGFDPGVFSHLFLSNDLAKELVSHSSLAGVGFTGSQSVGRKLYDYASQRQSPIPVFSEMGSVNPQFMLPSAMENRPVDLAKGYHQSLTLGVGQFCTNPGVIFVADGPGLPQFRNQLADLIQASPSGIMLSQGIANAYKAGAAERASMEIATATLNDDSAAATPAMFETTAAEVAANPDLLEELFGPAGLLVVCPNSESLKSMIDHYAGQLATSIHWDPADSELAHELVCAAQEKAGRIVSNGFPTGVEVCAAMVHGGPYPASTDSRFSAVGIKAISRWMRPVCYQDMPDALLPVELQEGNPLGIQRVCDGIPGTV